MKEITADRKLIAYCGLYCGACRKYIKEKCPGCQKNEKASWCKVRICCMENSYKSCADCQIVSDLKDCKKLNNFIAKLFALILRSDRNTCIEFIREKGYDEFAQEMSEKKMMTIKK